MILIHEHYTSPDPAREAELAGVRERNAAAGLFATILPVADGGRKTFADLFTLAAERFPGEVCVVANSDIAFDASLAAAEALLRRGARPTLIALSRWDDPSGPSMEGRIDPTTWRFYSHSQDTWMFVAGRLPPFGAGFTLGIPACESRLAYEAVAAGVAVINPALSVQTWHHHASAVRSWQLKDAYRGPLFFPRLTTLEADGCEGYVLDRTRWRTRKQVVRC
ncbi:MAG: hypothetical protein RLZZ440_556 [Planctomycetota bacterium]